MTSFGFLDNLLIADHELTAADAQNSVTVNELIEDALTLSTYTNVNAVNLKYTSATGNYTLSTGATITNGTITNGTITNGTIASGTIPTLTAGTTTSTAANITNGTVQTLTASTANITTGTVATLNSTTGTIANLSATASTFLGAITGSTNVINIGSGQIYKNSGGKVLIGSSTEKSSALSLSKLQIYDANLGLASNTDYLPQVNLISASATAAVAPYFLTGRSRGSIESPTAVQSGDNLGNIVFGGHDGTGYRNNAAISYVVDGAVSSNNVPTAVLITTGTNGGAERFRIASAGQIGIGGANYGTSGQALVSNGDSAAPSWQLVSAITRATAVASTSGTAIDFTGIPSGVKRITVMFDSVSISATSVPLIQLGSTTFTITGYTGSAGGGDSANGNSVRANTIGFNISDTGVAAVERSGIMQIVNISSNTWVASFSVGDSATTRAYWGGGSIALSGTLDRLRLTTLNGTDTFDKGSINILYES
jgi:hypothetical protein